jgi:NAD(P)-dependent dehydrogenase (short-subunit alcohol dehydrogenase family)
MTTLASTTSPLHGRTALITGASRGIGAAIARELTRQGARVAITYKASQEAAARLADELSGPGRTALALQADSADPQAVSAAVDRVAREFGRLDILVNNAGIWRDGPIDQASVDDAQEMLAVHVLAVIAASRMALPHMPDGGRILSIGSCLAQRVPGPGMSLYSMSKSALIGLTRGMARDLGPRGITVNVVDPGPTDTDMNPADGEHAQAQRELIALGRYGRAEEVASVVAFLAGHGGSYVTGASIAVDGGQNA